MSSPCPHVRFNHTVTTEIYTLSLHDALPIFRDIVELARQSKSNWREGNQPLRCDSHRTPRSRAKVPTHRRLSRDSVAEGDRKSTRLNSSHTVISYAVFCLKKKIKYPAAGTKP